MTYTEWPGILLAWFDQNKRELPWRETKPRDPYHVWVSEIMLQQTRTEAVKPYFTSWMERFPTIEALAEADEADVLHQWQGLGYYSRARNLHKAALLMKENYGSAMPQGKEEIRALPGIGDYTAGAILSMAFGKKEAAIDGNVLRVYARLYGIEDDMDMPSPKGTKADYYNSGYDRGHLCPAGDNKWNQKAMDECFLMTNMCPQTHALNAGIWNSIEQQCRTWAKKYGRVYIVCGPIFLNKQHRKLGKNKVVVPDAFFKVILRTGKNPQAIGFICRNQGATGLQKKDFVNSVDEVERITGYDFFSKLPDNIEKKIEAKADINRW